MTDQPTPTVEALNVRELAQRIAEIHPAVTTLTLPDGKIVGAWDPHRSPIWIEEIAALLRTALASVPAPVASGPTMTPDGFLTRYREMTHAQMNVCGTDGKPLPWESVLELVAYHAKLLAKVRERWDEGKRRDVLPSVAEVAKALGIPVQDADANTSTCPYVLIGGHYLPLPWLTAIVRASQAGAAQHEEGPLPATPPEGQK